MAVADNTRKNRRARRLPRSEAARARSLADAARAAGEAFAFEDEGLRMAGRAGAGWSALAATIIAGAMLFLG